MRACVPVSMRASVHVRICCMIDICMYLYRAYDKIMRWPDNMSGHFIFATDIWKNKWTIVINIIILLLIIIIQVCTYCIHTVYKKAPKKCNHDSMLSKIMTSAMLLITLT